MGIVSWLWQWTLWSSAHTAGDNEFNAVDCCFLSFSQLRNYCCLSYSRLRDISAQLLTKIIASFASHMNMRKGVRVCTLFALSVTPCMTHTSTIVPTGWLVCIYMQVHELCLLMLTRLCLTSSSLPVYYALSVMHAHQLWCNGKTGHAQCNINVVCLHFKS